MQTRRKPAEAFPVLTVYSSVRLSTTTRDALECIQATLAEWHLSHSDADIRRRGLDLTADYALRVVLATFARDYSINITPSQGTQ